MTDQDPASLAMPEAPASDEVEATEPDKSQEILKEYFALKDSKGCIHALEKKETEYVAAIQNSGRLYLWRQAFEQKYNGAYCLGQLTRYGIEGELLSFPVNTFSNAMEHVLSMTTQQRVSWEPAAINTDFESEAQVTLAKGLLQYYQRHKSLDSVSTRQVSDTLLFGEGHVLALWDDTEGDNVTADPTTHTLYKTGDITYHNLTPLQVVRDVTISDFTKNKWFLLKVVMNKYDLIKKFPQVAEALDDETNNSSYKASEVLSFATYRDTDNVICNVFLHKKSPALPFGRMLMFVGEESVLSDGHLPSDIFPLDSMMVGEQRTTNFGYSTFWDALPLQRMLDILTNAIATNISAFVTINVLMPEGADLSASDITGGMNFLKYKPLPNGAGEPKALQLLATPAEAYRFLDWVENHIYKIVGLNDVITGNPDTTTIQSGSALALRATQAISFNSLLAKAYIHSLESLGNITLKLIQANASATRLGLIAGNQNKAYLKSFSKKDLNQIDRVTINVGNPLSQTPEGRMELAQIYMKLGITDPHSIGEVLQTGNLEVVTAGPHAEMMQIKKENELLSQGKTVKALLTQNHLLHIKQHQLEVLNDPSLVNSNQPGSLNDQIVANTLAHIMEHIDLLKELGSSHPELAAALNLPVIAPKPAAGPIEAPKPGMAPQGPAASMNGGAKVNLPTPPPTGGVPNV